jgi:hypothetical protein
MQPKSRVIFPTARRGVRLRLPWRLVAVGIAVAVFVGLWQLLPPETLAWVLGALVAVLTWMASYGYRRALHMIAVTANWLERLEEQK